MNTTTTDREFNGWVNRETWAVNLWLTNDSGTAGEAEEVVRSIADEYEACDALEAYVDDLLTGSEGFAADLVMAALNRVVWLDIVKSLRAE